MPPIISVNPNMHTSKSYNWNKTTKAQFTSANTSLLDLITPELSKRCILKLKSGKKNLTSDHLIVIHVDVCYSVNKHCCFVQLYIIVIIQITC